MVTSSRAFEGFQIWTKYRIHSFGTTPPAKHCGNSVTYPRKVSPIYSDTCEVATLLWGTVKIVTRTSSNRSTFVRTARTGACK